MKLSSISLIAAALAVMAGSTTAAPTSRPFERDVGIYSRAPPEEHQLSPNEMKQAQKETAYYHKKSAEGNRLIAPDVRAIGWHDHALLHESVAEKNENFEKHHREALQNGQASNLKTYDYAVRTHDWTGDTIAKIKDCLIKKHGDVAKLCRKASHEAKEMNFPDHHKFHADDAKRHEDRRDYLIGQKKETTVAIPVTASIMADLHKSTEDAKDTLREMDWHRKNPHQRIR